MKKKEWLKIALVLAVILFLIWFSRHVFSVNPIAIRDWITSFGIWAPLVFIVAYTIRPLILFPASILSFGAGLAFGPLEGFAYIVAGAIGGATVAFYAATLLGDRILKNPSERMKRIRGRMEEDGFIYILVMRLVPFLNFDLVSYLAGMAKVRYGPFILATAIGILPGTFGYVYLGSSLVQDDKSHIYIAIFVFVLVAAIPFVFRKKLKNWLGLSKRR
ncbi:TVP38/TMEM64 family protein [Rossellomorea marisflavi]|jgi:uncharacterized membrane protein YdjX (TVP38/TMEM64 family)|uniref:TVP38/TMEM64 family protein n=1 Tax=Rossellomorea marisflavi TaxID=189381 RepID=UPI0028535150|nr:TVP38/TMEM64 family protein [Rossellomorea marisflavi]MDR4938913.1 TVP38/TMEM64 family protein [Rossellomorea marisflavi]